MQLTKVSDRRSAARRSTPRTVSQSSSTDSPTKLDNGFQSSELSPASDAEPERRVVRSPAVVVPLPVSRLMTTDNGGAGRGRRTHHHPARRPPLHVVVASCSTNVEAPSSATRLPVKRVCCTRSVRPELLLLSLCTHSVAQWLSGQRTWNSNSVTPVRFPGRATVPLGGNLGQVVQPTHIASPISQLQETGVQKGSFRCLSGYTD